MRCCDARSSGRRGALGLTVEDAVVLLAAVVAADDLAGAEREAALSALHLTALVEGAAVTTKQRAAAAVACSQQRGRWHGGDAPSECVRSRRRHEVGS